MYKLFMEIHNPTDSFVGKKLCVQGFAVYNHTAFILHHTGICAAYDLQSRKSSPIGVFKLESYNDDPYDERYVNHANDAMFGGMLDGEKFPLMYVTAGNSGDSDENGYIVYCAVEQIRLKDGIYSSETVQKIFYKDDGIENTRFQSPGWGWPASLVDVKGGWYYMLSTRYRAKKEFSKPDNVLIITKFCLPDVNVEHVTLYPTDIVDQFELPLNILFTQGGTVRDSKIWYMFGNGNKEYPNGLRVIDLQNKNIELCEDLSNTPFADEEVECCAFFGEKLLINTQGGKIYERTE